MKQSSLPEAVNNMESFEDGFRRAFRLAYFIHRARDIALEIATAALAKLEVAATAQVKRLYYHPAGPPAKGSKAGLFRSKVSLDDLPLLQRLVYIESESRERQAEDLPGSRKLSNEDLTIRFIKHLVQITVRRNSFHVALGISRLLHSYGTSETMRLHDSLLDDPDRGKTDDYFRARKALLMQELKARFGEQLTTIHVARGEERFETTPAAPESSALVAECLNHFTPWGTTCLIPEGLDPSREEIPGLSVRRPSDEGEHRIEVNRMHAILHPDCYRRLAAALKLDPPENRLELPSFHRSGGSDEKGSRGDRGRPPEVSDAELVAAAAYLAAEAVRRRRTARGLLRVVVDGMERGRLDPTVESTLRLELETGADLIELRAVEGDGEVLLATHLLAEGDRPAQSETARFAVVLEAGQEVFFNVRPLKGSMREVIGLNVDVGYRETNPIRAMSLLFQRWRRFVKVHPALKPAVGFALLILLATGLTLWLGSSTRAPQEPKVATEAQPKREKTAEASATTLGVPPAMASGGPQPSNTKSAEGSRRPDGFIAETLPRRSATSEGESTRGLEPAAPTLTLSEVKKVFIDCDDPSVREALVRDLGARGRLLSVERRDDADAALQASVNKTAGVGEKRVAVSARLVGPTGRTLWRTNRRGPPDRYRGSPEEIASRVVQDLMNAISSAHPKPPL